MMLVAGGRPLMEQETEGVASRRLFLLHPCSWTHVSVFLRAGPDDR